MPRPGLPELLNLARVVSTGRLMQHHGDERTFTARFQKDLAQKIGAKHALAVNSGTSALITALVASGVGPGDEVLVPAYTWVSTAIAPLFVGAIPVLVDIDETLTIDPEDLERKITPFSRAIIPVHMLNLVCDMNRINDIANRHELIVIEDACQAVGVRYKGQRVGSIGHLGVFSFNHYKNITSGEGGAVLTSSTEFHRRAEIYHDIGTFGSEYTSQSLDFVGCNMRISEITGAVLHAQLRRLDRYLSRRQRRRQDNIRRFSDHCGGRVSPHNDSPEAVGLTFTFDDEGKAADFASRHRNVERVSEIRRHDYLSWLPVLQHCRANPRTDPFRYARRKIAYEPDMCRKTLEVLSRTCVIS